MAEGGLKVLLERERPGKFRVMSAGTAAQAGFPATLYANEASKIWGADLSHHRSQQLSRSLIEESDLILAMTPQHASEIVRLAPEARAKTYLFKNFPFESLHGEPVEDPVGQALERYNESFLEIGEYLGKYLPEIIKRIDEKTAA
jgi:protein-tyrosine-phosphatase